MKDKSNIEYPEIISFAYWIRKSNIIKFEKIKYIEKWHRVGRGLVLHIPPSNVITGFLYSWAFGLAFGNSNIIKVPSSNNILNRKILSLIENLLSKKK